jgi:hypothetical protein
MGQGLELDISEETMLIWIPGTLTTSRFPPNF